MSYLDTIYTPTPTELYWEDEPEPLTPTTDTDELGRVMDVAVAYENHLQAEEEALRRYRGPERVQAAFERLTEWRQVAGPERVAVVEGVR